MAACIVSHVRTIPKFDAVLSKKKLIRAPIMASSVAVTSMIRDKEHWRTPTLIKRLDGKRRLIGDRPETMLNWCERRCFDGSIILVKNLREAGYARFIVDRCRNRG